MKESKTVTIKSIDDYIRLVNKSNPDYKEDKELTQLKNDIHKYLENKDSEFFKSINRMGHEEKVKLIRALIINDPKEIESLLSSHLIRSGMPETVEKTCQE